MNLIDDTDVNYNKKKNNTKKIMVTIIVLIVILLMFIIGLVVWMFYLQSQMLKVSIDGKSMQTIPSDLFVFEDNTVYTAIKDFATYAGYEAHNGDEVSEDETKCFVRNTNENAYFTMGEAKIYKKLTSGDSDYEYFDIDKQVKMINGKLYSSIEGIQRGFNVQFTYNQNTNQITIFTLPYLAKWYTSQYAESAIGGEDANFSNQKAILYNLLVVKNINNEYGVINIDTNATRTEIIGTKYKEITFVESTKDFMVKTSNNKVGIISYDSTTKISPEYDDVKQIDKDLKLYLVTNNNKQGVINDSGRTILYLEYDDIGIESSRFPEDALKNQYILYDAYIPVMRAQKWGIMDKNGNNIIPLEYDSLGCMKSSSSNGSEYNSTILIPQYNAVVVSQNGKYGLVDVRGNVILTCGADGIYSKTSNGKMSYWLVVQNNEMDLLDYLNKNYKPADTNENTEKQENNVQNTTEQNVNGQTVQNQSGQEGQSTTQNTAAQNAQNGLQNGQVTNQTTNNGQGTAVQQTANPQQSTN
ncbi:kinase domain protein [Clostridium sp. CAG:273]|nr:kinase domain protein [Clostridium sp. CAG:273]